MYIGITKCERYTGIYIHVPAAHGQNLPQQAQEIKNKKNYSKGVLNNMHTCMYVLYLVYNINRCVTLILPVQVMMGGEWFEELFGDPSAVTEETILSTALETLNEHLGISQPPSHSIVSVEKVQ